jgi:hypothetical protein
MSMPLRYRARFRRSSETRKNIFDCRTGNGLTSETAAGNLHTSTTQHGRAANMATTAYEVQNPSFADLNLEQQIQFGINDWCIERRDGHQFFGRTKAEAEAVARMYGEQVPA